MWSKLIGAFIAAALVVWAIRALRPLVLNRSRDKPEDTEHGA